MNKELSLKKATVIMIISIFSVYFILRKLVSGIIDPIISTKLIYIVVVNLIVTIVLTYISCKIVRYILRKKYTFENCNKKNLVKNIVIISFIISFVYINYITIRMNSLDIVTDIMQISYFHELKADYSIEESAPSNYKAIEMSFFIEESSETKALYKSIRLDTSNDIWISNLWLYWLPLSNVIVYLGTIYIFFNNKEIYID